MPFKRADSKFLWITVDGVRQSARTTDWEDASALEAKLKHDAWLSERIGIKPPKSWQQAVERRVIEKGAKKSWSDEKRMLLWWHAHLGDVNNLNMITREMIDDIVLRHRRGVDPNQKLPANTTANKYVRVVSGILNAAEREWAWGNRAPVLRTYPEPEPRDVCPEPKEVLKLTDVLPQHSADIALLSVCTLHRRGPITALEWKQIDWERRAWITNWGMTKTGKPILSPLNETAMSILRRRFDDKKRDQTLVFAYRGKKLKQIVTKAWRKHREAVGLDDVRLHTMRHCGNSWLARRGVSVEIRARIGGWRMRGAGAIDRYTHLFVEDLRPYVAMLDDLLVEARVALDMERAQGKEGSKTGECTFSARPTGVAQHVSDVSA